MPERARKLLAPALSLTLLALAFTFDQHGVAWFWSRQPGVATALAVGGAVCWSLILLSLRKPPKPSSG